MLDAGSHGKINLDTSSLTHDAEANNVDVDCTKRLKFKGGEEELTLQWVLLYTKSPQNNRYHTCPHSQTYQNPVSTLSRLWWKLLRFSGVFEIVYLEFCTIETKYSCGF